MNKPVYLLITWIFPSPTSWRGAFAYDYAKAIERDGRYRLVVFMAGPSYDINGVRVHGYRSLNAPSGIPFPPFWFVNRLLFRRALEMEGIDPSEVAVVDAFANNLVNEANVVRGMNPRAKVVTHHHDQASFGISSGRFRHFFPFKLIKYFWMRHLQESVDVHVFISQVVRKSFLNFPDTQWTRYEDYRRISAGLRWCRKVRIRGEYILPNGVDLRIFHPADESRGRGNEFVIGCIGNFVELKDQQTLIRAVEILLRSQFESLREKLRVIFVGSGPQLTHCQRLASCVEDSSEGAVAFEFRREVSHDQLADFYRGLDLFVLPSYFEGFGCVFAEAYASGVPFITCEGQGMDDMIPDEERRLWLTHPKDPDDLAQKLREYIVNRRPQHLRGSIDIDVLVPRFLNYLSK